MQGVKAFDITPSADQNASQCSPYVREAYKEEYSIAARVLSLAFANDPTFNWMALSKGHIDLAKPLNKKEQKYLELLFFFFESLIISCNLVGGRPMVIATPNESTGVEDIHAAALWIPHRKIQSLSNLSILWRSKQHRTVFGTCKYPGGWGFTGFKASPKKSSSHYD